MNWLHKLWVSSRSTLKYPRTMGSRPLNFCRASSKSGRWFSIEGGGGTPRQAGSGCAWWRSCSSLDSARGSACTRSLTCWAVPPSPDLRRLVLPWRQIGVSPRAHLCIDICLHHEYEFKPTALHRPDGLWQSKALAIPDVECPNGNPGREWGSAELLQLLHVQAVSDMEDQ